METENCYYCDEVFAIEDLRSVDSHLLCENCLEDQTLICSRCGESLLVDNNAGSENFALFRSCYDEAYTNCSNCNDLLRLSEAYYTEADNDDKTPLCYDCYCERNEREKGIRSYNYKPDPIFYGSGNRKFGFEIEVDFGGFNHKNAKRLLDIANRDFELIYIKSDSSLDNGFEIVTHPCDLYFFMNTFPWKELLDETIKMGYRGHSCSTAGMHIHLGRVALSSKITNQEIVISRIIFFFAKHWDEILIFSRRNQAQIDRWARKYSFKNSPRDTMEGAKESSNSRYNCINILNPETVEFRVFRSSLKLGTIIAALQFVDAICDAAISMTDEEMQALSWQQFVKDLDPLNRKELVEYLKIRQLYVNEKIECEEDV
jgi:hypothetical protein